MPSPTKHIMTLVINYAAEPSTSKPNGKLNLRRLNWELSIGYGSFLGSYIIGVHSIESLKQHQK